MIYHNAGGTVNINWAFDGLIASPGFPLLEAGGIVGGGSEGELSQHLSFS